MMGNEKAQLRKEEIIFGKPSLLIDSWSQDLKQPGTQALIIIVTAALAAGACFFLAHLLRHADEPTDSPAGRDSIEP